MSAGMKKNCRSRCSRTGGVVTPTSKETLLSHFALSRAIEFRLYQIQAVLDDHGSWDPLEVVDLNIILAKKGSILIDFGKVMVDLGPKPKWESR